MALIESVEVNQDNYNERTGYQEDFLGIAIPLPEFTSKRRLTPLKFKQGRRVTTELKYWNYSVVMCKQRRLAFFSAVNVNAKQRPTAGSREGDRWYFDKRIDESDQIGAEFYKEQKTFEADRSQNPFDRGHLTRRLDAQWGRSSALQKRNGDDSFHWTNCAPQHYKFNQGAKQWLGLEEYVIKGFSSESGMATVFNGPIFDAPLSTRDGDGEINLQIKGKTHPDPRFGEVSIPKLFFKIVVCKKSNRKLAAAAFIMSQEDFLLNTERVRGMEILTESEARIYQVRIADIENLTGLRFRDIDEHEVELEEGIEFKFTRPIRSFNDIVL